MEKIMVNTGSPYSISIGQDLIGEISALIGPAADRKFCIVTDDIVAPLYCQSVEDSLTGAGHPVIRFVFPHGEGQKTLETAERLLEFLAENQMTRSDALIALGGGVTGDLTGFAAAIYLRGIDFFQLPTTLLAAVDSSVGGKTGVNLKSGKNLAGAFWQPKEVVYDTATFATLTGERQLDGIAEAIKSGIIGDPKLFRMLADQPDLTDTSVLRSIVVRSIAVKKKLVEQDERDTGQRQLLNLGHTAGHAIESCSGFTISHGHAVAMGMRIISRAAESKGWCSQRVSSLINKCLDQYDFPVNCHYSPEQLAKAALNDKKRAGGLITLVVPEDIGKCTLKQLPITELQPLFARGLTT